MNAGNLVDRDVWAVHKPTYDDFTLHMYSKHFSTISHIVFAGRSPWVLQYSYSDRYLQVCMKHTCGRYENHVFNSLVLRALVVRGEWDPRSGLMETYGDVLETPITNLVSS